MASDKLWILILDNLALCLEQPCLPPLKEITLGDVSTSTFPFTHRWWKVWDYGATAPPDFNGAP